MSLLADMLGTMLEGRTRRQAARPGPERPVDALARELVGASGEVSGLQIARQILDRYGAEDDAGKLAIFRALAAMDLDPARTREALAAYEADPSRATYRAFAEAAEPPRQELIRRLNRVPGATGELVAMRADLLRLGQGEATLEALDLDFRHLFASWFNRGFLVLRPITWETPAHLLEKVIAYEAVHDIDGWDALRRRLAPADRRCFAFFHPAMPDEPLIFVEVALTRGVAGSIAGLLAEDRDTLAPEEADTAVFYSISNCQAGLAGVSFGNSLIKQVAADLAAAFPGLATFCTLSPIPGLARWAETQGLALDPDAPNDLSVHAATYLMAAKRGTRPADPVARFHLGNGATLHAIHPGADRSERGLRQSGGAMVTYLYDIAQSSQNHERFAATGEIAASDAVRALAAKARPATGGAAA